MLHGTRNETGSTPATPAANIGGWPLVLCGYLAVWQPLSFAAVAAGAIPALAIRGWLLGLLLGVKLGVTATGLAAVLALFHRRPGAIALLAVALTLAAAMDLLVYTTSIFPNNRLPGTTPFYMAWSLVFHGGWLLYLWRSRRIRRIVA
ncbi:MAG: hypothetical protein AB7I13_11815 [Vicinamibacterales bacterium]